MTRGWQAAVVAALMAVGGLGTASHARAGAIPLLTFSWTECDGVDDFIAVFGPSAGLCSANYPGAVFGITNLSSYTLLDLAIAIAGTPLDLGQFASDGDDSQSIPPTLPGGNLGPGPGVFLFFDQSELPTGTTATLTFGLSPGLEPGAFVTPAAVVTPGSPHIEVSIEQEALPVPEPASLTLASVLLLPLLLRQLRRS